MAPPRVWYVSYGSNLSRARFAAYLTGARAPGSAVVEAGSRDRRPPADARAVTLPHQLSFGRGGGRRWGPGGVAFVDPTVGSGHAYGLAHLVTADQFADVLAQENGWSAPASIVPPSAGESVTIGVRGWYRSVVGLDPIDGRPAVTFTHPVHEPGSDPVPEAYARVIADGLRAEHGLDHVAAATYLATAPGVGRSADELTTLLAPT